MYQWGCIHGSRVGINEVSSLVILHFDFLDFDFDLIKWIVGVSPYRPHARTGVGILIRTYVCFLVLNDPHGWW